MGENFEFKWLDMLVHQREAEAEDEVVLAEEEAAAAAVVVEVMAAEETVTIRIVIEIVTGDPHAGQDPDLEADPGVVPGQKVVHDLKVQEVVVKAIQNPDQDLDRNKKECVILDQSHSKL